MKITLLPALNPLIVPGKSKRFDCPVYHRLTYELEYYSRVETIEGDRLFFAFDERAKGGNECFEKAKFGEYFLRNRIDE